MRLSVAISIDIGVYAVAEMKAPASSRCDLQQVSRWFRIGR